MRDRGRGGRGAPRSVPDDPLVRDVLTLDALPECDLVAAGFPCQDLSQAGRTAGIGGRNSGLVKRVFELLEQAEHPPRWLLLENVPFMLQLDRGDAMRYPRPASSASSGTAGPTAWSTLARSGFRNGGSG